MKTFVSLLRKTAILVATALSAPLLSAQITITISPVIDDPLSYRIDVAGSGAITSTTSNTGYLYFAGSPFLSPSGFASGLTFGDLSVTSNSPQSPNSYVFYLSDPLSAGSSYHFTKGSSVGASYNSRPFVETFAPGEYEITGGSGIFGATATGTFSILSTPISTSAVPEPSTYATLVGLAVFGMVASRRRRSDRIV